MAGRQGRQGQADPLSEDRSTTTELASLAPRVQARFIERGVTLATAESCTGGLIGHIITEVSGSSAYYLGGVVSYANAVKIAGASVSPSTLDRFGAVSEEVATEMARGIRARLGADVGAAVTGIAGPDGGSVEKPVGLTWIAVAGPTAEAVTTRRFVWDGDRSANKIDSARAVLELLLTVVSPAGS